MHGRPVFRVEAIAEVIGGRIEPTDDYRGGTRAIIRIDPSRFNADATVGLDAFSHLESSTASTSSTRVT